MRLAGAKGFWSYYLPISGILAQSGIFEVTEAAVAQMVSPELGTAYLGTQGDEWDAQKDMMAGLIWLVERRAASARAQKRRSTADGVMQSAARACASIGLIKGRRAPLVAKIATGRASEFTSECTELWIRQLLESNGHFYFVLIVCPRDSALDSDRAHAGLSSS